MATTSASTPAKALPASGGSGNNNNNNNGGGGQWWNPWRWVFGCNTAYADTLPHGVGGEAADIQGTASDLSIDATINDQLDALQQQTTEDAEYQQLEDVLPQLQTDQGDVVQDEVTSEQDARLVKSADDQQEVEHDIKTEDTTKPVTTDTTTKDTNTPTNTTTNTHLTSSAEEHIFRGNINNRGQGSGYHWEGDPTAPGQVVPGTSTPPDARGVYEAQVTVNGVPKIANGGYSSFFPTWMTREDVLDAINEGYNNRLFIQGNEYAGETSTGIVVGMYINAATGDIISAFPWYEPGTP